VISSAAQTKATFRSSRNVLIVIGTIVAVGSILLGVGLFIRLHAPKPQGVISADNATVDNQNADKTAEHLDRQHQADNGRKIGSGAAPPPRPANGTAPSIPPGPRNGQAYPLSDGLQTLTPQQQAYQDEQDAIKTRTLNAPVAPAAAAAAAGITPDLPTLLEGLVHPAQQPSNPESAKAPKNPALPPDAPSPYQREPPAGQYVLVSGTPIPCRLDQTVVSELPGRIYCRVTTDVGDENENVLIPVGSRLQGSYENRLPYGDGRLLQVWDRLIYPDHSSINLLPETGGDADGSTGLTGRVNRHTFNLLKNAVIATVFAAGIAVTQRQNTSLIATPSIGSVVGQSAGAEVGTLISQLTRQDLTRSATFRLDPGAEITVPVGHDMVFEGPYAPTNLLSKSR